MDGPLPQHERWWRHPSELAAEPPEEPRRTERWWVAGTALLSVAVLAVVVFVARPRHGTDQPADAAGPITAAADTLHSVTSLVGDLLDPAGAFDARTFDTQAAIAPSGSGMIHGAARPVDRPSAGVLAGALGSVRSQAELVEVAEQWNGLAARVLEVSLTRRVAGHPPPGAAGSLVTASRAAGSVPASATTVTPGCRYCLSVGGGDGG